jgi:hypothetical protein
MRFGVIKTLVESKLVESFKKNNLKEDMRLFNTKLLKNKDFCKMMSVYDNLNENKGLDKESANYLIDDLVKEFNSVKLNENTIKFIKSWTSDVVKENKYSKIDDLIYGDTIKPEKKSIARKEIVESLNKISVIKENKTPKVPISTLLKVANNTAKKYLETLTESDRQKVLDVISVDDKTLKVKFEELKENTISKLDNLINESDEELNKRLTETKDRIQKTIISKDEYVKLWKLNQNI